MLKMYVHTALLNSTDEIYSVHKHEKKTKMLKGVSSLCVLRLILSRLVPGVLNFG